MKKGLAALVSVCIMLQGCSKTQAAEQSAVMNVSAPSVTELNITATTLQEADASALPDHIFETYYLSPEEPVHAYLQNNAIQKFFHMWVKEAYGEEITAHWNYDTLARVQLLDHDFNSIAKAGGELYTCTFSMDHNRYGYIIVLYGEGDEGPYIKKWSLIESTPYLYDLRANSRQIAAALKKTDIDLSTASALRAEWIDTDKKRGDRIILFTDGKEDNYICYLGDGDFTIEKID